MRNYLFFGLVLFITLSIYSQERISKEIREQIKKEVEDQLQSNKTLLEKATSKMKLFGDLRVRAFEEDWNTSITTTKGIVTRGDRARMRFRIRLNVKADITKNVLVHARLRSGDDQIDLITAGSNDEVSATLHIDKLYTKFHKNGFWAAIGRNTSIFETVEVHTGTGYMRSLPDHDGFSAGYKFKISKGANINLSGAYYIEKHNSSERDGKLFGGQAVLNTKIGDGIKFRARTSFARAEFLPMTLPITTVQQINDQGNIVNKMHFNGDMAPTYSLWYSGAQVALPNLANLTLVGSYYKNLENYNNNPESRFHSFSKDERDFTDQTNGYAVSLSVGSLKKSKSYYAGVCWIHMQKYAFIDYFYADYFNRTSQFGSSNFEGLKLFAGYAFTKQFNVLIRTYLTDQLVGFSPNQSEKGSARRFKLDLNYKF